MKKGFTLVELLFVMAIISILAGIGISQMSGSTDAAKIVKAKAELRTLLNQNQIYFANNGHYALSVEQLDYEAPSGYSSDLTINNNLFCVEVKIDDLNKAFSITSDSSSGIEEVECARNSIVMDLGF